MEQLRDLLLNPLRSGKRIGGVPDRTPDYNVIGSVLKRLLDGDYPLLIVH